jgi:methylmalonyl-CoA mutase C-terminal domain/subunit
MSGAHLTLVPRVLELLRDQGATDVVVTVGRTIPQADIAPLKELGVSEVFTPALRPTGSSRSSWTQRAMSA